MKNNYLNIVGLSYRARKCTIGEELIVKDIQHKRIKLLLLANDIGQQTRKKLTDKCKTYNIPYVVVDDRFSLGNAIGKSQIVAIGILDIGFAHKIQSILRYN